MQEPAPTGARLYSISHDCPIEGVQVLASEAFADERGTFLRCYCEDTLAGLGLPTHFPHHNISTNSRVATLRGLHYQIGEPPEYKLVRCVSGRVWDVILDLRKDSPSFGKWWGCELAGDAQKAIYVPAMCAHGYITLEPNSSLYYLTGTPYRGADERGVCFNDPALGIDWRIAPAIVSSRDRNLPLFKDAAL